VCNLKCTEALCVYCIEYRCNVCLLHSEDLYCVCTAQCRVVLCVYCTVQSGTVCVLHILMWYSVLLHILFG